MLTADRPFRLAVVTAHPVHYVAPWFRMLAARPGIDLTVFFFDDRGVRPFRDPVYRTTVHWDVPLLEGYRHRILRNVSPVPGPHFLGSINPSVTRVLRGRGFEAVWIEGWRRLSHWLAAAAVAAAGIPMLMRGDTNIVRRIHPAKRWIRTHLLRALFARVTHFLALGTRNREFYESFGVAPDRITFAPNAVDNAFFMARAEALAPRRLELRRRHGLDPALPVVLFVGRLAPFKRPGDVLEALHRLRPGIAASLVFVGEGALRSDLLASSARLGLDRVRFAGFRTQRDLPEFYAMADVLVLPSAMDATGTVVNEAMCFGVPCVVSDQTGVAGDLVVPGKTGFVHPVGRIEALAEGLGRLLSDADLRRTMGDAARRLIADWSYERDTEALVGVLERIRREPCMRS